MWSCLSFAIAIAFFGGMSCTRVDRYRAHHPAWRSEGGRGPGVRVGGNDRQFICPRHHVTATKHVWEQLANVVKQPSAESSQSSIRHAVQRRSITFLVSTERLIHR